MKITPAQYLTLLALFVACSSPGQDEEKQGFYVVTIDLDLGVVTNIAWNEMHYRTPD